MSLLNYPDDPARVGSPDYEDVTDREAQLEEEVEELREKLASARSELEDLRGFEADARHVLRRVECVLRDDAHRHGSAVYAALADECECVLMESLS